MPIPRVTRARELAAGLTSAGLIATADVREVGASPVVLVGPPRLEFSTHTGAVATWRLMAISGSSDQHIAWQQIDELVDQLAARLPVETAEPTAWATAPGQDARPAYAVTFIETVE